MIPQQQSLFFDNQLFQNQPQQQQNNMLNSGLSQTNVNNGKSLHTQSWLQNSQLYGFGNNPQLKVIFFLFE